MQQLKFLIINEKSLDMLNKKLYIVHNNKRYRTKQIYR